MRITVSTARVLAALLADPAAERYGLDLMQATGLTSGTLYPILRRLLDADWLTAHWEQVSEAGLGRPPRRYYQLTAEGATQARQALAELRNSTTVPDQPGVVRPAW